jgi:hypothetical protein
LTSDQAKNKLLDTGSESSLGSPAEGAGGAVYTYQNPDGSIIGLLYRNGVVVTVELASGVTLPRA